MTTLKDRLNAALAEKPSGSKADMARDCTVSDSAVSFWFSGKTKALRGKNLITAARYLGVDPSWLSGGRDLKPVRASQKETDAHQYVKVSRLELPVVLEQQEAAALDELPPLAFRRDWLKGMRLNPDCLALYTARGNAMFPSIEDGDLVLVDTSVKTPVDKEIFVLFEDPMLGARIRRILIGERKEWILRADNPDKSVFQDERPDPSDIRSNGVLGKVVWRGGGRL